MYASLFVARYPWKKLSVGLQSLAFDPAKFLAAGALWVRYGGTGAGGGFSFVPDFQRYACFSVWPSAAAWADMRSKSEALAVIRGQASEWASIGLVPYKSHGAWSGNTFDQLNEAPIASAAAERGMRPIAVLTRATIRLSAMVPFWREVAPVYRELTGAGGAHFAIGFGEIPWIRQATISVWQSESAMTEFAYRSKRHGDVVARTRRERWYSEEMFTRFWVDYAEGSLNGVDLDSVFGGSSDARAT